MSIFQNSSFDSRNEARNSIEKQEAASNEAQESSSIDDTVKQNRKASNADSNKKRGIVLSSSLMNILLDWTMSFCQLFNKNSTQCFCTGRTPRYQGLKIKNKKIIMEDSLKMKIFFHPENYNIFHSR